MQQLARIEYSRLLKWTKSIPGGCFVDRDELILEECRGRTVLHIGAADSPFEVEKGRSGELLHQKVRQVARKVVGVDIDAHAVRELKVLGIEDIVCADVCERDFFLGETFEIVLCCDVIEHVLKPSGLLAACRRHMDENSKLIVTTIGATALKPAIRALLGRECVHTDHVAYYSLGTLGRILTLCDLTPLEFGAFSYPTINPLVGAVLRALMRLAPGTADGIIMTAFRT